ncbi:MAG TPA: recombination mediator RecR [Bacteroidia bacterium]|nr:recombination protein RecR [Sphingobacteriales bacterium]HPD63870.1 recombination mediator RecR [Bacteroidia bacterium]HRS57769.1 recombination mediator RecR [Bacteroidia bacterium]HRU67290.1 recombination mediator RecR [Bacteroidia bacterium]
MEYPSEVIRELVEQLTKLPGIGKRTALRMVLSLLKDKDTEVEKLGELIKNLKTKIKYCQICHTISDDDVCKICSDHQRDKESICVVESHRDLIAIENTGQYRGLYHVLGGLINPLEGTGPDDIHLNSLLQRVERENPKEVIFALSATLEGDTTMYYIGKELNAKNVRTSVISRGISVGGELEFADEITLGRSILQRTPYKI